MQTYPFKAKPLPYSYYGLEPYIDRETMFFHHDKHYQSYVDNLNKALENYPQYHNMTLPELLKNLSNLPNEIRTKVRNNGGGAYNHGLFFDVMTPKSTKEPHGNLATAINKKYSSYSNFKEKFKKAALDRFGSGWAWLVKDKNGELMIVSTPNQDVPLDLEVSPVLMLDVWEHAYYLKYQNLRGDYIDNWFNVVDWEKAEENYMTKLK